MKQLHKVEREIRNFVVEGMEPKSLRDLRRATASLIDACQTLEARVVKAMVKAEP